MIQSKLWCTMGQVIQQILSCSSVIKHWRKICQTFATTITIVALCLSFSICLPLSLCARACAHVSLSSLSVFLSLCLTRPLRNDSCVSNHTTIRLTQRKRKQDCFTSLVSSGLVHLIVCTPARKLTHNAT